MKSSRNHQNHALYDPTANYHYHYHYHYPICESFQEQNPERPNVFSPSKHKYSSNNFHLPQQMSFSSEQNQWKRYLNPKVSRMYQEYQLQQSRFSQNNDTICRNAQSSQTIETRNSDVMYKSDHIRFLGQQNSQLKKLDQLYLVQKKLKDHLQQKNKSEMTMITNTESIDVQSRITGLQKQIQRLKNIQQECIYLRDKFYLHVVLRHPEQ